MTEMNFMKSLFQVFIAQFIMDTVQFIMVNLDFIMAKLLFDFSLKFFLDKLKDTFN